MGGGDVKLFAALGALCGFSVGLNMVFLSFVAAVLFAVVSVVYHGKFFTMMRNVGTIVTNMFRPAAKRKVVPAEALTHHRMGPAILVGVCFQLFLEWRWR